MSDGDYTLVELCIVACAEAWRGDGEILASAIGVVPRLAAAVARLTFEPDLLTTDGEALLLAEPLPLGAGRNGGVVEGWMPFRRVFDTLWGGRRHVMMGAAQIDRFGSTNISCIGDWHRPTRQLLGMRGAPGNSINHTCSYWVPIHSPRTFVQRVDVVSGAGYEAALWPEGVSPRFHEVRRVVTNLAVLDCRGPGGTARVATLHPGVALDDVVEATGFELAVADDLHETRAPTGEELRLIREVLDPDGRRLNAQNSAMTYALDRAFYRAVEDDDVAVIVLRGAGDHFSAGHDIGSPERDVDVSFERRATLGWDHVGKQGADARMAREQEVYVEMCRRWRSIPKPTIAMVHGACIAGGLMLAWVCDLLVASDDAFFADPVLRMGVPGVEWFAHPWQLGPRFAKEFLFLGARMDAARARELGAVNRVVPRDRLEEETLALAEEIAQMPRFGLALAKRAVNQAEDLMGLQAGIDSVFGLHHVAHAHNAEVGSDALGGQDAHSMRDARLRDTRG
jgi:enoyl-CoA hydratase